jgi:hypothetical protein
MDTHAIYQRGAQARVLRISEPRATAVRELMIHPFHHMTDVAYSSIFNLHIDPTVTLSLEGDHDRKPLFTQWVSIIGQLWRGGQCDLRLVRMCLLLLVSAGMTYVFCADA